MLRIKLDAGKGETDSENGRDPRKSSSLSGISTGIEQARASSHSTLDLAKKLPAQQDFDSRWLAWVKAIPPRFRNLIAQAMEGKASPRRAIAAKCYSCVNFENATMAVEDCACFLCPLRAYRPRSAATDT